MKCYALAYDDRTGEPNPPKRDAMVAALSNTIGATGRTR